MKPKIGNIEICRVVHQDAQQTRMKPKIGSKQKFLDLKKNVKISFTLKLVLIMFMSVAVEWRKLSPLFWTGLAPCTSGTSWLWENRWSRWQCDRRGRRACPAWCRSRPCTPPGSPRGTPPATPCPRNYEVDREKKESQSSKYWGKIVHLRNSFSTIILINYSRCFFPNLRSVSW